MSKHSGNTKFQRSMPARHSVCRKSQPLPPQPRIGPKRFPIRWTLFFGLGEELLANKLRSWSWFCTSFCSKWNWFVVKELDWDTKRRVQSIPIVAIKPKAELLTWNIRGSTSTLVINLIGTPKLPIQMAARIAAAHPHSCEQCCNMGEEYAVENTRAQCMTVVAFVCCMFSFGHHLEIWLIFLPLLLVLN